MREGPIYGLTTLETGTPCLKKKGFEELTEYSVCSRDLIHVSHAHIISNDDTDTQFMLSVLHASKQSPDGRPDISSVTTPISVVATATRESIKRVEVDERGRVVFGRFGGIRACQTEGGMPESWVQFDLTIKCSNLTF
ncbi:unnamed protein product [Protopolystoma xenopodis]|uniref:Uncharacterized protein n=1 Tax=Protopolystoma xenopodis TaxID=117903 RepID=A0A3S5C5G8_9PLAT|nr:unnamed protein product [Protopolystoma xenopodis]